MEGWEEMHFEERKNYVRFRKDLKDKNGKWYQKTIFKIPKLPNGKWAPLHFPFIYQGSSNILIENIKKNV